MSFDTAFQSIQLRQDGNDRSNSDGSVESTSSITPATGQSYYILPVSSATPTSLAVTILNPAPYTPGNDGISQPIVPLSPIVGQSMRKQHAMVKTGPGTALSRYSERERTGPEIVELDSHLGVSSPFAKKMLSLQKTRRRRRSTKDRDTARHENQRQKAHEPSKAYFHIEDRIEDLKVSNELKRKKLQPAAVEYHREEHPEKNKEKGATTAVLYRLQVEIIESEERHVQLLEECASTFIHPFLEIAEVEEKLNSVPVTYREDVMRGFSEFVSVMEVQRDLLSDLRQCLATADTLGGEALADSVSHVFLQHMTEIRVNMKYCERCDEFMVSLAQHRFRSKAFNKWEKRQEQHLSNETVKSFQKLLLLPMQRIMEYHRLLSSTESELTQNVASNSVTSRSIRWRSNTMGEVLHQMAVMSEQCRKELSEVGQLEELFHLTKSLHLPYHSVKASRKIVQSGVLQLVNNYEGHMTRQINFYVLTDILLLCTIDKEELISRIDLKDPMTSVLSMSTSVAVSDTSEDCGNMKSSITKIDHDHSVLIRKRFVILTATRKFILECKDQKERNDWVADILKQIMHAYRRMQQTQQRQITEAYESGSRETVIRTGWIQMRNSFQKSFHHRYVILERLKCKLQQKENGSVRDSFSLLHGKLRLPSGEYIPSGDTLDNHFILETPQRTYVFQAETDNERDEWMMAFESAGGVDMV